MRMLVLLIILISSNAFSNVEHIKELVGYKKFKTLNKIENVEKHVLSELELKLPKKYKNQAKYLTQTIIANSKKYNLDPLFVLALISGESSFNPDAIGPVKEIGLMQLRPHVAKWVVEDLMKSNYKGESSLKNMHNNVRIGTRYLAWLRNKYDQSSNYIAAYNLGPGTVKKLIQKKKKAKDYPIHVMKRYLAYYEQ